MGWDSRYRSDVYAAGEDFLEVVPLDWQYDGTRVGVIVCHAATSRPIDFWRPTVGPGLARFAEAALLRNPAISPLLGSTVNWGNDLAVTRMGQAYDHLIGDMGCTPGRVVLVGASMGWLAACNWARENYDRVALMLGVIPACDVNDLHVNNRGGFTTASVNSAYGGAYSDAVHGPTRDPTRYAEELAGIPMRLWYSEPDELVIADTVREFDRLVGDSCQAAEIPGSDGHTDLSLGLISERWVRRVMVAYAGAT